MIDGGMKVTNGRKGNKRKVVRIYMIKFGTETNLEEKEVSP